MEGSEGTYSPPENPDAHLPAISPHLTCGAYGANGGGGYAAAAHGGAAGNGSPAPGGCQYGRVAARSS